MAGNKGHGLSVGGKLFQGNNCDLLVPVPRTQPSFRGEPRCLLLSSLPLSRTGGVASKEGVGVGWREDRCEQSYEFKGSACICALGSLLWIPQLPPSLLRRTASVHSRRGRGGGEGAWSALRPTSEQTRGQSEADRGQQ